MSTHLTDANSMTAPILFIQRLSRTRITHTSEWINPSTETMTALPLMGRVSAGRPLEAIEDPDWVEVPERLAQDAQFVLRVQGDSMIDDQIEDGDLILIQTRSNASNGEIVVALIDGLEATLKRFFREPNHIRLQPAKSGMTPLRYRLDQVEVIGVVTAIMRMVAGRQYDVDD
jgi:repressor LexA